MKPAAYPTSRADTLQSRVKSYFATIAAALSLLALSPYSVQAGPLPSLDVHAESARMVVNPEKERAAMLAYTAPNAHVHAEDEMTALNIVARSFEMQGRYPDAINYAQQWYNIAEKHHDLKNMAQAMDALGADNRPLGKLDLAVQQLKKAADLASEAKDPDTWGESLFNLSVLMLNFGDYENALVYSLESQKLIQKYGNGHYPPSGFGARANIYYRLGNYVEAQAALNEAQKGLPDDDNIGAMEISGMGALIAEKLGRSAEAESLATKCLKIQKQINTAFSETYQCELVLATLAVKNGSAASAREHLDKMRVALNEIPESSGVSKIILERDYHQGLADLAKFEGRMGDVASENTIITEFDRKIWSARESSRAAVAAAEIKTEGKDLSIALLEARNTNLLLVARQRLIWVGSGLLSAIALLAGLFMWYRAHQLQLRQEQRHVERTRIARDLHDTLLQNMAGTQMQLQAVAMQANREKSELAGRLDTMVQQLGVTMASARDAVWQMRSAAIQRGDLIEALEEWIAQIGADTSAKIIFETSGVDGRLSPACAEDIFRVAQEAVGNAIRHAAPKQITIRLIQTGKTLELSIIDDGRGFELQSTKAGLGGHWGLVGMRERAERLNGSLAVSSDPGSGTRIVLMASV